MMMLENTIANFLVPYGVCSGEATVTVYKRVSMANATAPGVFRQMMEFSQIASAVLAKRGMSLPGVISADDRDVACHLRPAGQALADDPNTISCITSGAD